MQIETVFGVNYVRLEDVEELQAENAELKELLKLAVEDINYMAYINKNAGEKCNCCLKNDTSCTQSSDCWRWQHSDRLNKILGGEK